MHQLTTIAFSHYVEKARWALDRFGIEYEERRYLPLFHFAGVYRVHRGRHGRSDNASTKLSTPVLETPDGRVLCDSAEIVRYVSDHFAPPGHSLYPTDEVAEIERTLHDELGPHTRRAAYGVCFGDASILRDMARHNVGTAQARAFIAAMPLAVRAMRKVLQVDATHVARSIDKIRREMEALSARLADGRRYLVGDNFTAADIALACMAAPTVLPPEYSAWLPPLSRLQGEARTLGEEMRETPAGKHALRMFREQRRRVVPPNEVAPQTPAATP